MQRNTDNIIILQNKNNEQVNVFTNIRSARVPVHSIIYIQPVQEILIHVFQLSLNLDT